MGICCPSTPCSPFPTQSRRSVALPRPGVEGSGDKQGRGGGARRGAGAGVGGWGGPLTLPLVLSSNLEAPAFHRNFSHGNHQRGAQASCFSLIRENRCRGGEGPACAQCSQLGDGLQQESQVGGKHGRHMGNGHGAACAQNSECLEDAEQLAGRVVRRATDD